MTGRAVSLTWAFFFARKSATACTRACTSSSTSEAGSVRITATRNSRSVFRRGAGRSSRQPAPSISSAPAITESPIARSSALRPIGPITEMSPCGDPARQGLAARRHDPEGRLVAVDAAVVRGIADGRADVAARLEAGQARGERGRRAARGAAGRARRDPTDCWWCRRPGCRTGSRPATTARWSCRRARPPPRAGDPPPGRCAAGTLSFSSLSPHVVGMPTTSYDSLIVIGTPCSGPQTLPLRERGVGLAGAPAGRLHVAGHDRVELRVEAIHPREEQVEQPRGRRSSGAGCRRRAAWRCGSGGRSWAPHGSRVNVTVTEAWISCSPGATGTAADIITRGAISGRGEGAPASCTATTRPTFSVAAAA